MDAAGRAATGLGPDPETVTEVEEEEAAATMRGVGPETESVQDGSEPQASIIHLSIPESITVLLFFFSLYPASFRFITRQQVLMICETKFHLIKFKVSTQM